MKKLKLFLAALIFMCSVSAISPANAQGDPGAPCGGIDPDSGCGGSSGGDTSLPINNAVWLLVAAGAVIGTKVAFAKSKVAVTK
ncbi:hypothetical protein [Mucilaginibacter sp. L3T2-6]|uniref:hypothetical protein n=1 Tax=Mucilaginibacter sp. L3T2-6 TaxID=3062491 RepID=UPI002676EBD3|nr:hypothetical protein [Mucilaginibacter sp. L3T2-6]MDO3644833.1 hypothetical protein [Mucilaginibacter sp. L3T2-6]MDV6217273.1 hypothetical protein [Mucilaginibacter sp. L3T2-6]